VTKNLLFRGAPSFVSYDEPLILAAFAVVSVLKDPTPFPKKVDGRKAASRKKYFPNLIIHTYRSRFIPDTDIEIDCDETAMGLPPVTSAVFLIAK
jgi:hypothetical protein